MSVSRKLYHLYAVALALMFLLAIYVPFFGALVEDDIHVSKLEKRTLAPLPSWPANVQSVRLFPARFTDYYADHFGFRQILVSWYKQLKYHLGDSPSRDVTIGRDGWVFLGGIRKGYTNYGDPIGDARHVNKYTQAGLRQFAAYVSAVRYWLRNQGIEYLFMVAPNKHSIYPEQLPDYVQPVDPESAADQLFAYLRAHTHVPVLDLRPALLQAKGKEPLYFYRDSHWNHFGSNIAQYAIRQLLAKLFPGKIDAALFPMKAGVEREGDLHGFIGLLPRYRNAPVPDFNGMCMPRLVPKNAAPRDIHSRICEGGRLRVIVFRDSFFTALENYFSRVFARSTYVWTKLDMAVLRQQISQHKPDLVIEEWVERDLPKVPELTPVLKQIVQDQVGIPVYSLAGDRLKFNQRIQVLSRSPDKVVLQCTGVDPYVLLPRLKLSPDTPYIVHVRLRSSVRSGLELYFSSADRPDFSAQRVLKRMLAAGDNDIYFWLQAEDLGTYLRLDPLWGKGRIELLGLEVIALPEPTSPLEFAGQP